MISKLILFILSLCLSVFYVYSKSKNNKSSKLIYICLIALYVIFFTFRDSFFEYVGTDYLEYQAWFEYISLSNLNFKFSNLGFNLLICITKIIFNNFYFFLFCCSIIINTCIFSYIKNNSKDFIFSTMIYTCLFFFSSFNVLRQWLACSIFLYAYKYICEKNLKKYLIFIIIASLFHPSAVILVMLYPIINSKKKLGKKEMIIAVAGILIYLNLGNVIINILEKSSVFGVDYLGKYGQYTDGVGNYTNFIISIFSLIILNFKNLKVKLNDEDSMKLVFLCLTVMVSLISTKAFIFNRINLYFLPSLLIVIPTVTEILRKNNRLIIKYFITILLLISFMN